MVKSKSKGFDPSKLINVHDFVKVIDTLNDRNTTDGEAQDLKKGSVLYVGAVKSLPIDENDFYTQRIHFLCHTFDKDVGSVDSTRFYLVDPSGVKKCGKNVSQKYADKLALYYTPVAGEA